MKAIVGAAALAALVLAGMPSNAWALELMPRAHGLGGPALYLGGSQEGHLARRQATNTTGACPTGQKKCLQTCIDENLACCPNLPSYCLKPGDHCCSISYCCGFLEVCVNPNGNETTSCSPQATLPGYAQRCGPNNLCLDPFKCVNGTCGCSNFRTACKNNTQCCATRPAGASCIDGTDCFNLLQCINGICGCPTPRFTLCQSDSTCCNATVTEVPGQTNATDAGGNSSDPVPVGAIAGGVGAGVAALTIAGVVWTLLRRRNPPPPKYEGPPEKPINRAHTDGTTTYFDGSVRFPDVRSHDGRSLAIPSSVLNSNPANSIALASSGTLSGISGSTALSATDRAEQDHVIGTLQAPHWLFSRLAGPEGMAQTSVQYVGPLCAVVTGYLPTSQDEVGLNPGNLVELKHVFKDGWGVGINIDTSSYGALPLACLQFTGNMLPSVGSGSVASKAPARRNESAKWLNSAAMANERSQVLSRRTTTGHIGSSVRGIAGGREGPDSIASLGSDPSTTSQGSLLSNLVFPPPEAAAGTPDVRGPAPPRR